MALRACGVTSGQRRCGHASERPGRAWKLPEGAGGAVPEASEGCHPGQEGTWGPPTALGGSRHYGTYRTNRLSGRAEAQRGRPAPHRLRKRRRVTGRWAGRGTLVLHTSRPPWSERTLTRRSGDRSQVQSFQAAAALLGPREPPTRLGRTPAHTRLPLGSWTEWLAGRPGGQWGCTGGPTVAWPAVAHGMLATLPPDTPAWPHSVSLMGEHRTCRCVT